MKKVCFEDIPELFVSGKLSEKEVCNLIWEELYTHPKFYQLTCMDEDLRSDFLLRQYHLYPSLCRKYQRGRTSFKMFLKAVLFYRKFVYLRRSHEKELIDHGILRSMSSLMPETSVEDENLPINDNIAKNYKEVKLTPKKRLISETSLLILAMKFCHDMDDTLLVLISKYTKIPPERLDELMLRMQKQSERKRKKFNLLRKKRDKSYFLHTRYALELKNRPMSPEQKENIQKKYEMQTRLWKKHNETLSTKYISSPTNQEISEELGITPRQVSFYINHFTKNKTKLFIPEEAEDLPDDAE